MNYKLLMDMRKTARYLIGAAMMSMAVPTAFSQSVGIKTNLVNDALLSPNLGLEIGLAPKWTLQLEGEYNGWKIKDKNSNSGYHHQWKHWFASIEPRYWFCQRFAGHFISINAIGGEYNFGHIGLKGNFLGSNFNDLNTSRYQGYAVGAGFNYGYAWPVAKHWNIEAEIGIGWLWTRYEKYPCTECGTREKTGHHNYVGPTKLAVSVEYLF